MFNEWATPQEFYDALDRRFHFTCDVCALPENAKHTNFYTPEINGLKQTWNGTCWMNPPYDEVPAWVAKAYRSAQLGVTVVALLASRSSETVWWHEYVMRSSEIWYVKNRLWFSKGGIRSRSNHASTVVIFYPGCTGLPTTRQIDTSGEFIWPARDQMQFSFAHQEQLQPQKQ